jgi:Flp pilus assembly pilin Flp
MMNILTTLVKNEDGQDLIEYSLLVAFMMASTSMVIADGGAVQGILSTTTNNLNSANQAAS